MHSVRIVYDAWVPADAPDPRVVEVDGSTIDARWADVADVEAEVVPTVPMVREALARHRPAVRQRLAAYALVVRDDAVLLTRHSVHGPRPGAWTLRAAGVDHGEAPAVAVAREVLEETGLVAEVGALLGVHDEHFTGTAPHGRRRTSTASRWSSRPRARGHPGGPRRRGHHGRGRLGPPRRRPERQLPRLAAGPGRPRDEERGGPA